MAEYRRDILQSNDGFRKIAVVVNSTLLAVHLILFIIFFFLKINFMAIFNVCSIILYVIMFRTAMKHTLFTYLVVSILEVMIHMIAATLCTGWETGFPLYTFSLVTVVHYAYYVHTPTPNQKWTALIASVIGGVSYLVLKAVMFRITPFYAANIIPETANKIYIFNAGIVFGIIAFVMTQFTMDIFSRERDLHSIADRDELTRMFNRHKMRDILELVQYDADIKVSNYSTAILDIDDFKLINDTYGHEAGDYVLKNIAEMMINIAEKIDFKRINVGRWGGEEFLVVQELKKADGSIDECIETIKRIKEAIYNYDFNYKGNHMHISITAGISLHKDEDSISATIKKADDRLYKGKNAGKNCIISID